MFRLRSLVDAAQSLRRPTGTGRTPRILFYAVLASLVLFGLDVAFAVLLDLQSARITTNFVDVVAQGTAAAACFWSARRLRGAERRWRVLIGLTAVSAIFGSIAIAPTLLAGGVPSGDTSLKSYLALVVFYGVALAGLLSLPTDPIDGREGRRRWGGEYRWRAITLLDCLMIVGSITLLQWGTTLASRVRDGPFDTTLLQDLIHQAAGLILATTVVLIASFRQPRSPATLALLAAGLLINALNFNIGVHIATGRGPYLPSWRLLGFALSFLLIFLAALVPVSARLPAEGPARPNSRAMWFHAAMPYTVLAAAGLLVLGKLATDVPLDWFEIHGMVTLLLLALIRQMFTLAENTRLLAEIRVREQQLQYQAFHDPLTGLANRALFARRLRRALSRDTDSDTTQTHASQALADAQTPVSVLFMDLDNFKHVNDTYGHAAGDELLKISAERLRAETRAADTVARLGGDEFAIILDGGGPDDPRRIGERLATAVRAPCLLAGRPYTPRASLGLVTLDSNSQSTPDNLLHQADQAMYAAKRAKGGTLVVYRPDLPIPPNT
ncbi:GGDEF domain-containing protein [Frankia sp. CNm7]|uniref:GGDEF domain-containing protein n=1 Tax=Frankia nepalensis TaxID=1836974 RepID=A0A937RGJ0_9ACTN|nr:GGDEF domain-containing protein [Frankia nepalensis]MBL7500284.1 GGDEF domain-containing protein [Frankia nepalensis]MBL7511985.1 GGDEF domain-containing protein [Frankia nepalensis]MBL7522654.1 GGDEF domain-containing protein [Frankia nepalensis]MBL7631773.1 GGDEF domain-containing protein [Frankia nepalensis]